MIGWSKINERLHDMTPKWDVVINERSHDMTPSGMLLDGSVSPNYFFKRYKKHLILIILNLTENEYFWGEERYIKNNQL